MVETKQARSFTLYTNQFFMVEFGREIFGLLTQKQLKRGVFRSVKELEKLS